MDTRRLFTFVRIVDAGSLTKAADVLRVAQPALSQQMQSLEAELGERLLVRSARGVVPTAAGLALYRHAQVILRQWDDAVADVRSSDDGLAGSVSVGLAPYSSASLVGSPLLRRVREELPRVRLRITDNFGAVLSEAMTSGRLDLAILYSRGPIRGVHLEPLLREPLALVGKPSDGASADAPGVVDLARLADSDLLLPGPTHTIRQTLAEAFQRDGLTPRVVAEVESVALVRGAIESGLGETILPWSVARRVAGPEGLSVRVIEPTIEVQLSLGTPSSLPQSEPARAVQRILGELFAELTGEWADFQPGN